MKKRKKYIIILSILLCVCSCFCYYVYNNISLRTAIFRSIVKGNWYIISEKDTLYNFGYFGVKKWLVDDKNNMHLLAENDDFCHNSSIGFLIGRSGVINGNYIYVVLRSYLGGSERSDSQNYVDGKLLVLKKDNLKVINEYPEDIKLIEAKICGNNLIVSGLQGFNIYDISKPEELKIVYKYRQKKFTEFQSFDVIEHNSKNYIVFARFAEGISVWDITNPTQTKEVMTIPIQQVTCNGEFLPKGLQCFSVMYKKPYVYATLAPMEMFFNTKNDRRGIITYDFSNIDSVKQTAVLVPKCKWYNKKVGDPQPSYMDIYKNKLYVNFGEKGIAVFDISNPNTPHYDCIMSICDGNLIQPIHINDRGILFAGDYYWSNVYTKKINTSN